MCCAEATGSVIGWHSECCLKPQEVLRPATAVEAAQLPPSGTGAARARLSPDPGHGGLAQRGSRSLRPPSECSGVCTEHLLVAHSAPRPPMGPSCRRLPDTRASALTACRLCLGLAGHSPGAFRLAVLPGVRVPPLLASIPPGAGNQASEQRWAYLPLAAPVLVGPTGGQGGWDLDSVTLRPIEVRAQRGW